MQDLITDKLASKRIPAASVLKSLPRLIGEYAKSIRTDRDRSTLTASSSMTKPKAASEHVTPATGVDSLRTYSGSMAISGSLSADNGQSGNWTGSLKTTLYVGVDGSGSGTGYETFSGYITLHVDGKNSGAPLSFSTPFFSLKYGSFDYPSGSFNYGGLLFTLDVKGSFKGSQQTISEHLSLPYTGFVKGVGVSGSVNGSSSLKTVPLTIIGSTAPQSSYAGSKVRPFQSTTVSDLSGTTVTATVTLSKAANGTLTNLSSGTYNRARGIYTFTGKGTAVASAVKGLTFVAAGDMGSSGKPEQTGFTLHVTDGAGGDRTVQTNVTASTPLFISGLSSQQTTHGGAAIDPFHGIRISETGGQHLESIKIKLSNAANGTLNNLSSGFYNRKTGVYVINGTIAVTTKALNSLEFIPAKSGVATAFTITAKNTSGAFLTAKTTVNAKKAAAGASANRHVALFSQYVALGLGTHDRASALSSRHDLPAHPLSELAASHR